MEALELDDPLPKPIEVVGILFNLKKGVKGRTEDCEAEYDHIDTVYAIEKAIASCGVKTVLMEADRDLPARLREARIDIAFNIAEGVSGRGREAQAPALLTMMGIPFTGSDETALCLALDKALTKRLLSAYRIRTPRFRVLARSGDLRASGLRYPLIVKPNAEGSSKGISGASVVTSAAELRALAERALADYPGELLAEEYVEGREFTVGILGNGACARVFSPMEICYERSTQGDFHVYDYTVKQNYTQYVRYECPARLDRAAEAEMTALARRAYEALGCRDFARVDFRMDEGNRLYFIEINPLPGLAPGYSDYPMLAEACGMPYRALVVGVLNAAAARYGFAQLAQGAQHGEE